jgi:hypothetical protein
MKASFGAAALACALLLCAAPQVSAGSLQDAAAAHARGDYATAIRLLQRLAEQGNATAQCLLGGMYENGEGVPRDYAEAVRWYRRAADQEDARGKFFLGTMYGQGKGVPQDLVQAYDLLPLQTIDWVSSWLGLWDSASGQALAPIIIVTLGAGHVELAPPSLKEFTTRIEKRLQAFVNRNLNRSSTHW